MKSIKRRLYERGMRYHAQNLRPHGDHYFWREGRAWLIFFAGDGETGVGFLDLLSLCHAWHFTKPHKEFALGVQVGEGSIQKGVVLTLVTPILGLWLEIETPLFQEILGMPSREIGIRIQKDHLTWNGWVDPESPPLNGSLWRHCFVDFKDVKAWLTS